MATYYIRFDTDGDDIYFNLHDDPNSGDADFLCAFQCSAEQIGADAHPYALRDFADLSKEQAHRLMDLSDWFELACACWIEVEPETVTKFFDESIYDAWTCGDNIAYAERYITQDATADEIAEHAKHYQECFAQVVSESED